MKKEYDFSKGERGKFYNKNININIPVYLESETLTFVQQIAEKKNSDVSTVVNDLLKHDIKKAKYLNR